MQYENLSGLAWNMILFLFAVVWLAAAGYTFYSVLVNVDEMSFFWQFFGFGLLAVMGIISAFATAMASIGIYGYLKALFTNSNATFS